MTKETINSYVNKLYDSQISLSSVNENSGGVIIIGSDLFLCLKKKKK